MKTLFITLLLLFGLSLYGNDGTKLTKVTDEVYMAKVYVNNELTQVGYYINITGKLEPHKKWVEYNNLGKTVVKFEEGNMLWVKTPDGRKYFGSEIEVMKLKTKVERLERLLADN